MPTSKELRDQAAELIKQAQAQAAELIKQADAIEQKEKNDARDAILALMREAGLTPEDFGGKGSKQMRLVGSGAKTKGGNKERTPVAIQFRNPDNAEQTWTGRGREPGWIKGQDREKFRVKTDA